MGGPRARRHDGPGLLGRRPDQEYDWPGMSSSRVWSTSASSASNGSLGPPGTSGSNGAASGSMGVGSFGIVTLRRYPVRPLKKRRRRSRRLHPPSVSMHGWPSPLKPRTHSRPHGAIRTWWTATWLASVDCHRVLQARKYWYRFSRMHLVPCSTWDAATAGWPPSFSNVAPASSTWWPWIHRRPCFVMPAVDSAARTGSASESGTWTTH